VTPERDILEAVDGVAKALAHPLRRRILTLLDRDKASPSDIAGRLEVAIPVAAYHVRTLLRLGLVELVDTRQRRGALEHYYRSVPPPAISSKAWGSLPAVVRNRVVGGLLERVATSVDAAARAGGFERPHAHVSHAPLVLDEAGMAEVAARLEALRTELQRISAEAQARVAAGGDAVRAEAMLMLFESAGDPVAGA
jgi:DNA-binding transcriptional ArsR family regulator